MSALSEVVFLTVPGGCVAIMDAKQWSHPRDLRTRDTLRAASREKLVQALDLALRQGGLATQSFQLAMALGMGPLAPTAMRDEVLRRFDARSVSAVWIPVVAGERSPDTLPGYRRGARSAASAPQPTRGRNVGAMTLEDRCREVLVRTYHALDDSLKAEFLALIETETLIVGISASLAAAIIGAYFGITQILAILMLVVGGFFMGVAFFHAATDLVRAFALMMGAKDDADLDEAAKLIAGVIAVVSVEVVVALIAKGARRARTRNAAKSPPVQESEPHHAHDTRRRPGQEAPESPPRRMPYPGFPRVVPPKGWSRTATPDELEEVIKHADLSLPPGKTVLYSGQHPLGIPARQLAEKHAAASPGMQTLEQTEVGRWLDTENLWDKNHPLFAERQRAWRAISERFASQAQGNVTAVTKNSMTDSVFRSTELPALMKNGAVDSINGIPKAQLQKLWDAGDTARAYEMIQGMSP